ncbi:Nicotinate-nucleotide pyrophosphorylase (Carboxylating) [Fasciola gigantica]|uniref:Quinolinate phosphoribosyltransferase [decarboxylating] n=1 Tax=Fasciola gigantica TaxID=46835 RepID=A0A504YMG4_FASGI|nr:Nicotinate-nucleotide pyrophosphorylase (Carboxylating) [Fasciola gigantica]
MACSLVLNKQSVRKLVGNWLRNEGGINLVGFALKQDECTAEIRMCRTGVLAGSPFIDALYKEHGCVVSWNAQDGDAIEDMDCIVATATGAMNDLLFCERLAVSLLSRASGIATLARRMRKLLGDIPWKGDLRVPHCLTPGFELVEEYAMLLGGVVSSSAPIFIRQSHAVAAGGVDKAIERIRSKVGLGTKIEIECGALAEAMDAAVAGANVISFRGHPVKELSTCATQLKNSHPQVQIQLETDFDENSLTSYALSSVDFLATPKLSNGYSSLEFKVTYLGAVDGASETEIDAANMSPTSAFDQGKLQSPGREPIDEISSPTASAAKKSRLDDSLPDNPKTSSKPNGTPARNTNTSSVTVSKQSNQKRPQRNQRHQQHNTARPSGQRTPSSGGMQLLQMTAPRFMSTNTLSPRPQTSLGQGNTSVHVPSPLGQQNQSGLSMRSSGQQMQRLGPSMLGSGPNVAGGFLSMQPQQNQSPHNFAMGGTGPMMGGLGLGMRMGGPGGSAGLITCRTCGTANGPALPFCRNCRVPLR